MIKEQKKRDDNYTYPCYIIVFTVFLQQNAPPYGYAFHKRRCNPFSPYVILVG